ncbi:MAG: UPF0149 family protein [Gammaproteobacteria bacterium]
MEHPTTLPPYQTVAEVLDEANAYLGAAEAHGLLCGMLCLGLHMPQKQWIDVVLGNASSKAAKHVESILNEIFDISFQQLKTFGFDFQLLLPKLDEHWNARTECLAVWCQGFMMGVELSQKQSECPLSAEVKEALDDISQISKLYDVQDDAHEQDEQAFFEVSEYVRLAVMMIFTELNRSTKEVYH